MIILAIETSCDETAAAIIRGESPAGSSAALAGKPTLPVKVLSSAVASSEEMHVKTGGIVPEVAAREQVRSILPVVDAAMKSAKCKGQNLDAIAVTVGPGLIGSLLVGAETAKTLAYVWKKPIIPVNHLVAHLYASFVETSHKQQATSNRQISNNKFNIPEFPAVGLVVSGGHTDLVLMQDHGDLKWLGGTRDDAAGECFDKCSRLLKLGYPGGPAIEQAATKFKVKSEKLKVRLPRPLIKSDDYDFSFSGLKTAVSREVQKAPDGRKVREEFAWEIQEVIVEVLVAKVAKAVEEFKPKSVLLGGGVAANSRLRESLSEKLRRQSAKLFIPKPKLCTDNAVIVAAAAFYNYSPIWWNKVKVDPGMEIV